jgi:hypothetical protein
LNPLNKNLFLRESGNTDKMEEASRLENKQKASSHQTAEEAATSIINLA